MASYKLKHVRFYGREVPIIMQNENGPCPLLSIMNVLLLRNRITLSERVEIDEDVLLSTFANFLYDANKVDSDAPHSADLRKNLEDATSTLHKLATGIDVNPRFNSIRGFEFTTEINHFDLSNISLVHGWLVDPHETRVAGIIGDLTYNQVLPKLIPSGAGPSTSQGQPIDDEPNLIDLEDPKDVQQDSQEVWCDFKITESGIEVNLETQEPKKELPVDKFGNEANRRAVKHWLDSHSTQLTPYGLSELRKNLNDQELAVFFRNNHFSTIFKKDRSLYILVTDQGYLSESSVVWESLRSLSNDNRFYTGEFELFEESRHRRKATTTNDEQHDLDLATALAFSMEDQKPHRIPSPPRPSSPVRRGRPIPVPGPRPVPIPGGRLMSIDEDRMRYHMRPYGARRRVDIPSIESLEQLPDREKPAVPEDPYFPLQATAQDLYEYQLERANEEFRWRAQTGRSTNFPFPGPPQYPAERIANARKNRGGIFAKMKNFLGFN